MSPDADTGAEVLDGLDAVAEAGAGDPIAVRTDNDRIGAGVITKFNVGSRRGDLFVALADAALWDVEGGGAEPIELDQGAPKKHRRSHDSDLHREDWTGPILSISIETRRSGAGLDGEVVLRQPEPVYERRELIYYDQITTGRVKEALGGDLIAPRLLLKRDERPPAAATEVQL